MTTGPSEGRLLHRHAAYGYTQAPSVAMRGEPQALSEAEQHAMTRAAHERQLRAWQAARRRIMAEVDGVREHVHGPEVRSALRALERQLDALDRRLTGG